MSKNTTAIAIIASPTAVARGDLASYIPSAKASATLPNGDSVYFLERPLGVRIPAGRIMPGIRLAPAGMTFTAPGFTKYPITRLTLGAFSTLYAEDVEASRRPAFECVDLRSTECQARIDTFTRVATPIVHRLIDHPPANSDTHHSLKWARQHVMLANAARGCGLTIGVAIQVIWSLYCTRYDKTAPPSKYRDENDDEAKGPPLRASFLTRDTFAKILESAYIDGDESIAFLDYGSLLPTPKTVPDPSVQAEGEASA